MDGSNQNISLEAGLDINSSDMLVNIASPTFQHNWQRFQGKFLPNSLRFEKNGWAAGWHVHNFKYNSLRKKYGDIWIECTKFNNNPTYSLNIFDSEDSYSPLASILFTPESRIVSVDNGTASLTNNKISGSFNNKSYTITWNPETKEATIDNSSLSLSYAKNSDETWGFIITDLDSSYSVLNKLYKTSSLSGVGLSNEQLYDGYDTTHKWGGFEFDGTNVTAPYQQDTIIPIIDSNKIEFSYTALTKENLKINMTLEKFYKAFNDCKIINQADEEKLLVTPKASDNLGFNYYSGEVISDSLKANDKVKINLRIPVWFSISATPTIENSQQAKKADNIHHNNVLIKTTAKFSKYKATSVYDNVTVETDSKTATQFDNSFVSLNMNYRFNSIETLNTIEPISGFNTQRYLLSDNVYCFSTKGFTGFATDASKQLMSDRLGNIYTVLACVFNMLDYFEENNWADWTDDTNAVYTEKDISNIRSIKIKGESDSAEEYDDAQYIEDNFYSDEQLCDNFVCRLNTTPTEYTGSEDYLTTDDLYSGNTYIGNTYTKVDRLLTNDSTFWPFEYVPCFNYKDSNGITYDNVYCVDGTNVITDLNEFKSLVRGTFNSTVDLKNKKIIQNSNYNITRVVKNYNTAFDFDKAIITDNQTRANWTEKWDMWYTDYQNPADLEITASTDTTYSNYSNINYLTEQSPTISYLKPGVCLYDVSDYDIAIPVCNDDDIIVWESTESKVSIDIYHNHIKATELYENNSKATNGSVSVQIGSRVETFELPGYFGPSTTIQLTYAINYNTSISFFKYKTGKVSGGSFNVNVKAISYIEDKCWAEEVKVVFIQHAPDSNHSREWYMSELQLKWLRNIKQYGDFYNTGTPSGYIIAAPLEGFTSNTLTYNKFASAYEIQSEADKLFTFYKTPDSELNDGYIYIDRDTKYHSYNWLNVEKSSLVADNGGEGYIDLKVTTLNSVYLFYGKTGKDSAGNDVYYDYYYPSVINQNGHMKSERSNIVQARVYWIPDIVKLPTTLSPSIKTSINDLPHTFYREGLDYFNQMTFIPGTIDDLNLDTGNFKIHTTLKDYEFDLYYNINTGTIYFPPTPFSMNNAVVLFIDTEKTKESNVIIVPLEVQSFFTNLTALFAKSEPDDLISYTDNKYVCSNNGHTYEYNVLSQSVTDLDESLSVTDFIDYQLIKFESSVKSKLNLLLSDVVDDIAVITFRGTNYSINVKEFLEADSYINVLSTDVRTPNKTTVIGKIKSSEEYQIVKQQWNTTSEVTNFWWVDDKHILVLTDYYWILRRKTDELDDWNGDRFEDIYNIQRHNILDTSVLYYTVTNVYNSNTTALLLTFKCKSTYIIQCDIYDPRKNLTLLSTVYFELRHKDIGTVLNDVSISGKTAYFNTYSSLNAAQLLNIGMWSNTITDNKLIIGCHYNNNFDQWATVIDLNSFNFVKCIQGYGFVGLHGDLTGGMIPSDFFDINKGFNDTVQPFSALTKGNNVDDVDDPYIIDNISELNVIETKVVGTPERQWYIKKVLYGVVSHIVYESGNFSVKILPMTNNYDSVYKSPSFYTSVIGDLCVQAHQIAEAFKFPSGLDTAWNIIMKAAGAPSIFMFNPRQSRLSYIQQTLGQYAYVHYNSSESMPTPSPKDLSSKNKVGEELEMSGSAVNEMFNSRKKTSTPVLSDEYTFGKQIIEQTIDNSNRAANLYQMMFQVFAPVLIHIDRNLIINGELNQSATSDEGKKYSQAALENLGAFAASSILTESPDQGLNGRVVGIKSLDMFYSTSDKQFIYAGPGFVEHQFVADCVAQSSTCTLVEGNVMQIGFTLKNLTLFTLDQEIKALELAIDNLNELAKLASVGAICGTTIGSAVAAGFSAAAYALSLTLVVTSLSRDVIASILDVLCERGVTCEEVGRVTRTALSNEAKHKYGEKNEVFMWPCWGIPSSGLNYTDESVIASIKKSSWSLTLQAAKYWTRMPGIATFSVPISGIHLGETVAHSSMKIGKIAYESVTWNTKGYVPFYQASCYGKHVNRKLPEDMAMIEGVKMFLPTQSFKNENIGVSEPAFGPSLFQDYVVDKSWNLSQSCTYGSSQWITCKDTKLTSCSPSNMYVNSNFCGIATPYIALEVKRGISKAYMRPYAVTPNVLAFNCTGYNSIMDDKLYHSFDGLSYRIVEWVGKPILNRNKQTFFYCYQQNDILKRSNKFPPENVIGCFDSEPTQALETIDPLWSLVTITQEGKGMSGGSATEDKDTTRWAIPIFTEQVTTLPAVVKTHTAMPLLVGDGVTSLTTDLDDTNFLYKAPVSIDFSIGKNTFRQTEEYICSVRVEEGFTVVEEIVPSLGLKYIGSTQTEAYFYSKATRCYYTFTGSSLVKMDMMERFRDIQKGYWDFVNQEVIMPCLMTFKRLNPDIGDKDTETDNIIIPILSKGQVSGELPPPITTIFNDRSWYKCVSLPSGFAYQGPNRVIINRSVFVEYMLETLKENLGKWKKLNREKYTLSREYPDVYKDVTTDVNGVDGWTYNPFILVTSALGSDEDSDCMFEWTITFCWPIEMELIYGTNDYAVVNITADTMMPGGRRTARPTHIYLTKELFTRNERYGYYSIRYQSKNGAGNRERLKIWCDQYIAISSIECKSKVVSSNRTSQLTQQLDVQNKKEL